MNFHDLRLCNLNLVSCTDKTSTLLLLPIWISALWGTNLNFLVEAAWSHIDILLILEEISMNFMHNSTLIVILMVRLLCSMLEKIFHQTLSNSEPTETLIKSTWLKHSLIEKRSIMLAGWTVSRKTWKWKKYQSTTQSSSISTISAYWNQAKIHSKVCALLSKDFNQRPP